MNMEYMYVRYITVSRFGFRLSLLLILYGKSRPPKATKSDEKRLESSGSSSKTLFTYSEIIRVGGRAPEESSARPSRFSVHLGHGR